jgi:hypothetical protein
MRSTACRIAMLGAVALFSPGASAVEAVAVDAIVVLGKEFQLAEDSTDSLLRSESAQRLRRALEQELKSAAPACLAKGSLIELSLREVNPAGAVQSGRGAARSDLRVARNSWVVSIEFDYRLLDGQRAVLDQGSASLRDSGFLGNEPAQRISTEAFPEERRLVIDWFKARYCQGSAPRKE